MLAADKEQRTFQLERWRSIAAGVTETANSTFIGLIANKFFFASQSMKGALMTNTSIGLLISPAILWFCAKQGWTAGRGIVWFSILAAISCALASWGVFPAFAIGTMLAYVCAAGVAPLYLSIYEGNYGKERRGALFSKNYFLRIISSILFAFAGGKLLQWNLHWFPCIFISYAICFAVSAWCVDKMPDVPVATVADSHPLRSLRYVKEDIRFRWTLVSWMLLGFANLAMFPLRAEYLANPRFLNLEEDQVALYTAVIPNIARLIFNPIWGPLFDKMNFFNMRIILNAGFMLGFLSFFAASDRNDHWGLILGGVLFGISNAGADVVWNLWVTKIAPPDRTAAYMSVHSFLTGVRGVIAPLTAFTLTNYFPIHFMAFACAGLVVLASLLLMREKRLRPLDLPESA